MKPTLNSNGEQSSPVRMNSILSDELSIRESNVSEFATENSRL